MSKDTNNVINKLFDYEYRLDLSTFLKSSKVYVHCREGWDEARMLGQGLLCGCILLCSSKLVGHNDVRKKGDAVVEYNNIDIIKNNVTRQKIKMILYLNNLTYIPINSVVLAITVNKK